MPKFEGIYSRLVARPGVSPALKPLLERLYEETGKRPLDLPAVKSAMLELLEFLASREGRTAANCVAVDRFLCIDDDWEQSWTDLPSPLRDILADMGSLLHDAITEPGIAANFESLPEQLLERTRQAGVPPL